MNRIGHVSADSLLLKAQHEIRRLTPEEALDEQVRGAVLIDIRSDTARQCYGVVPGSVHVPRTVLEWRLDPASAWRNPHVAAANAPLILLCDHGWSSTLAVLSLRQLGHEDVADVIGGFEAWAAGNLPVIPAPTERQLTDGLPGMAPPDGCCASTTASADQRSRWNTAFRERPDRYGTRVSLPAVAALRALHRVEAREILELGGGQGRDSLYFAEAGFTLTVADFSSAAIETVSAKAQLAGLATLISTVECDVRNPLPFVDASFDGCYSHMLFCMALTRPELCRLSSELLRVIRPGGLCIYTARTTADPDFGLGTPLGGGLFELDGFAVHFFDTELITAISEGFEVVEIAEFEEGELPRRLVRVTMQRP